MDSLVVNIAMLDKSSTEDILDVGSFDNIRFNGPEVLAPGAVVWANYSNANDFFGIRGIVINERREAVISWIGGGVLQTAETVAGPWEDATITGNSLVTPISALEQFYRVRRLSGDVTFRIDRQNRAAAPWSPTGVGGYDLPATFSSHPLS